MRWWPRKKVELRESKAAPIVEPGVQTMAACVLSFEGTEICEPAAFCQYQRINESGYFAKGYSGSLESMKEKDRAMFAQQMRAAVDTWNGMRPSERAMWRPENDAVLKTSIPTSSAGALVRPGARGMESERSIVLGFQSLAEAKVDRKSRSIRCSVISKGKGNARDKRYYGDDAIEGVARHLNGARSFINHPGETEEAERPEGDVWDQCGFWKGAKIVEIKGKPTVIATLVCDKSAAGDEALAKAEAAIEYAREFPGLTEVYAGISINGQGEIEEREVDGETVNFVTEVTALPRADVVTQPARGGEFLGLVESIRSSNNTEGVAIMNEALRKQLASFAESLQGVLASKDDVKAADVLKMFTESGANLAKLAGIKEGDDEDKKDKKTDEAEDDEDKDKKTEEEEDDEDKDKKTEEMEDDEDEDEGTEESKKPKVSKESQRLARDNKALKKELTESKRRLASVEGKVSLTETAAAIKEAGLDGLVEAKDLAELTPAQRKAQLKMLKAMKEASPFGVVGTTLKGVREGDSTKPGAAFMGVFKSVAGNRGARG